MKSISFLAITLALFSGCSTPSGINPETPAPGTGYVDFIEPNGDRVFMVLRESPGGEVTAGTSSLKNDFMRLASPPGRHQFRVGLARKPDNGGSDFSISKSPTEQQLVSVDVRVGMITPVKVEFSPIGPYIPGQAYVSPWGGPPTIGEIKAGAYPAMNYSKGGYSGYRPNVTVDQPIAFGRKAEMPYYRKIPLF